MAFLACVHLALLHGGDVQLLSLPWVLVSRFVVLVLDSQKWSCVLLASLPLLLLLPSYGGYRGVDCRTLLGSLARRNYAKVPDSSAAEQ